MPWLDIVFLFWQYLSPFWPYLSNSKSGFDVKSKGGLGFIQLIQPNVMKANLLNQILSWGLNQIYPTKSIEPNLLNQM